MTKKLCSVKSPADALSPRETKNPTVNSPTPRIDIAEHIVENQSC